MRLFAIFGNPVGHSKSPLLHNSAFRALGVRHAGYVRKALENGGELMTAFRTMGLSGANVTVPFKEDAFQNCDEVRGEAKEIGAVNTLVLEGEKIVGYNTDAPGLLRAVESFGPAKKVLVLGAGGTAKAAAAALNRSGIPFIVANRSAGRLAPFRERGYEAVTWEELDVSAGYDLVLNTTSAGLSDDALPLPEEKLFPILEKASFAMDAIYGKETPFLREAKRRGLETKDGGDMLVWQAVLALARFLPAEFDEEKTVRAMFRAIAL